MNKLMRRQSCANPKFEMTDCGSSKVADNLDSCASPLQNFIELGGAFIGKLAKELVRQVFSEIASEIRSSSI